MSRGWLVLLALAVGLGLAALLGLLPSAAGSVPQAVLDASAPAAPERPSTQPDESLAHSPNVEPVGQIGGLVYRAVAFQEEYVYLGVGPRLLVIDVSNPATPTLAGQSPVLPGPLMDVAVAGDLAYAAVYSRGLYVIDLAEPALPAVIGFAPVTGSLESVQVAGESAYLVGDSLTVIDVSDPAAPNPIAHVDTGWASDLAVGGDYAYVAAAGPIVLDVSDPVSPSLVGATATPGDALGVAVAGDYAYLADGYEGLAVISISQPATPTVVAQAIFGGLAGRVVVAGDYAYVADWDGGLWVISVVSPTNPIQVGFLGFTSFIWDLDLGGQYVYAAREEGGLAVIQVTDPATPELVGAYAVPGGITAAAAVQDGYAYLATSAGLDIVDVSDPAGASLAGFLHTYYLSEAKDIAVQGDYVYLPHCDGLDIIDVWDPTSPTVAGMVPTPYCARDVAVAGGYAYFMAGSQLVVIDIADPPNAAVVGQRHVSGVTGVAAAGSYVYLACSEGLRILDVSDPTQPTPIGFYAMPEPDYPRQVAVQDNIAFVSDNYGLWVIDVSDPVDPLEIGHAAAYAFALAVKGNVAYLASTRSRTLVFSVFDPATPHEVGFAQTPGYPWGLAAGEEEKLVYVADSWTGLSILRVIDVPPAGLALQGPDSGLTGVGYPFTATVTPLSATLPITYVWQASGHQPVTRTGGLRSTEVFSWPIAGTQAVTVTARNLSGTVNASQAITLFLPPVPPAGLSLQGPGSGLTGVSYPFTATVSPLSATLPITYLWQASGHQPVTRTGGLNWTEVYSWPMAGTQAITVTARNLSGTVSASRAITLYPRPVPPAGVSLQGPDSGLTGVSYPFSATVSPLSATLPITYLWQASGHQPVTRTGGLNWTEVYSWPMAGTQAVTVTARNLSGTVSAGRAITLFRPVPPAGLALQGPEAGLTGAGYSFTATVSPPSATLPITYLWQASGHQPVTRTGGLNWTEVYSWPMAGTQAVTVTARNLSGTVSAGRAITLFRPVAASLTAAPTGGVAPLRVAFTNTSAGDYTISLWSFGDGLTSTLPHPTHLYRAGGVYTVSLAVSGPGGSDVATRPAYITVRHGVYLPLILRRP